MSSLRVLHAELVADALTLILTDLQNHDCEEALVKTERLLGVFTRYRERQDLLLGLRRVAEEADE
jgi:hypothetical protein